MTAYEAYGRPSNKAYPTGQSHPQVPWECDFKSNDEPSKKTAATSEWEVHNWQIPVPLGDCSIHVLFKKGGQNGRTFHKAFIMDGGKDSGGTKARNQIAKALTAVDKFVGHSQWKFHAWVVTHWDEDHYRGVIDLLLPEHKLKRNGQTKSFFYHYFEGTGDRPIVYAGGSVPAKSMGNKQNPRYERVFKDDRFDLKFGECLIGIDLFTRQHVFDRDNRLRKDYSGVIKNDQPRFCVVGANSYGVGSKKPIKTKPTANETSILAVLYWPGAGGGRCCYFTGGDGNPEVETDIVAPTLKGNTHEQLPQMPMTMMKLDHHGSSKEVLIGGNLSRSPVAVFDPVDYLVTPGDQYGHPTWDVLDFMRRQILSKKKGRLYTTRSPYWVTTERPSGKSINLKHDKNIPSLLKGFEESWRRPDDEDVEFKGILSALASEMSEDQDEYGKIRDQLAVKLEEELANQPKIGGQVKKRKKNIYNMVNERIEEEVIETTRQLGKALLDPKEEEPEWKDMLLKKEIVGEDWENMQYSAWDSWHIICEQPVIIKGDPFFLIHFYFSDNGVTHGIEIRNAANEEKKIGFLKPEVKDSTKPSITLSDSLKNTQVKDFQVWEDDEDDDIDQEEDDAIEEEKDDERDYDYKQFQAGLRKAKYNEAYVAREIQRLHDKSNRTSMEELHFVRLVNQQEHREKNEGPLIGKMLKMTTEAVAKNLNKFLDIDFSTGISVDGSTTDGKIKSRTQTSKKEVKNPRTRNQQKAKAKEATKKRRESITSKKGTDNTTVKNVGKTTTRKR